MKAGEQHSVVTSPVNGNQVTEEKVQELRARCAALREKRYELSAKVRKQIEELQQAQVSYNKLIDVIN